MRHPGRGCCLQALPQHDSPHNAWWVFCWPGYYITARHRRVACFLSCFCSVVILVRQPKPASSILFEISRADRGATAATLRDGVGGKHEQGTSVSGELARGGPGRPACWPDPRCSAERAAASCTVIGARARQQVTLDPGPPGGAHEVVHAALQLVQVDPQSGRGGGRGIGGLEGERRGVEGRCPSSPRPPNRRRPFPRVRTPGAADGTRGRTAARHGAHPKTTCPVTVSGR